MKVLINKQTAELVVLGIWYQNQAIEHENFLEYLYNLDDYEYLGEL